MAHPDEIQIGDFSKPVVQRPKAGTTNTATSPTKQVLDAAEARLDADAARDEANLKPLESYEDKLKAVGLDRATAAAIMDDVMLKGHYSEVVKVTPRVKARLRTRSARDTRRAQERLESMRLTYDTHYAESLARILLAASLEEFGNDKLPHPNGRNASAKEIEDAFDTRMNYVESMPDPALRMMFELLRKFDNRVSTALEEGAVENF